MFSFIHNVTRLIQNEQNTEILRYFIKLMGLYSIFSGDVWISGGQLIFHYKPGAYL